MSFAAIGRVLGLAIMVNGFKRSISLELPPHLKHAGQLQFLTNDALLLSIIFGSLSLILDIFGFKSSRKMSIFHTAVFNVEFLVTVSYWTLMLVSPNLLNQDAFDVSFSLDFAIHITPYVFLLIEYYRKKVNVGAKESFLGTTGIFVSYWAYVEVLMYGKDSTIYKYPYPFLNESGLWGRLRWIIGLFILANLNHMISKSFNKFMYKKSK